MFKNKFNVGDLVLPSQRAPKWLIKEAGFTQPRRIQDVQVDEVYSDYRPRTVYTILGKGGQHQVLAEELQLVKRGK